MYFEPGKSRSGLPMNPFKACCVPRPIGWLSTVSAAGAHNLAPYSQFQNVAYDPPMVMVAMNNRPDGRLKDTAANIIETGEFAWNMATFDLREAVVASAEAVEPVTDEFEALGISHKPAQLIRARLVAASPAHFECRLRHVVELGGNTLESASKLFVAEVVAIHLDDRFISEGRFDVARVRPLCRLGYRDYGVVDDLFEMEVPGRADEKIEFLQERAISAESGT